MLQNAGLYQIAEDTIITPVKSMIGNQERQLWQHINLAWLMGGKQSCQID